MHGRLEQSAYHKYLYELREEYVERIERELRLPPAVQAAGDDMITDHTAYFLLFGAPEKQYRDVMKNRLEHNAASLTVLDDTSLEVLLAVVYGYDNARLMNATSYVTGDEVLERRHDKVGESMRSLCVQRPPEEGALLLRDMHRNILSERGMVVDPDDIGMFISHGSSLVDRAVAERSSHEILARHHDMVNAVAHGWPEAPYEAAAKMTVKGVEDTLDDSRSVFAERMMSWLYGVGKWYSNNLASSVETIMEDIGRELIPPTAGETLGASISFGENGYVFPGSHVESPLLRGLEARYPRLLPCGGITSIDDADEGIREERKKYRENIEEI